MLCILGPYFTENIEFTGGNMGNGNIWDLIDALKHKRGLAGLVNINTHIRYKEYPNLP